MKIDQLKASDVKLSKVKIHMNGMSQKILKHVSEKGEVTLQEAICIAEKKNGNHLDQYPLTLLLEEGYLGITFSHTPPKGAENMREFSLARSLHGLTLPKNEEGESEYEGINFNGSLSAKNEKVFIKAKGLLYLDGQNEKRNDRFFSFFIGIAVAIISIVISDWLIKILLPEG